MRGQAHGIVWRKKPRVNIVNEADLAKAAKSLSEYFEQEKRASMGTLAGTLAGTLTEIDESVTEERGGELVGIAEEGVELARGIEPPTCGLQTVLFPTTDNLTPHETTQHDAADMALDGPELSCPGSSVVADPDKS